MSTIKITRTSIFTKIYLSVEMFQLSNSASSSPTGKHVVVWTEVSYIPARCASNRYSSGTHFHLYDFTGILGAAGIFCVIAPFSLQLLEFKASKSHVAGPGLEKHTCTQKFLNKQTNFCVMWFIMYLETCRRSFIAVNFTFCSACSGIKPKRGGITFGDSSWHAVWIAVTYTDFIMHGSQMSS